MTHSRTLRFAATVLFLSTVFVSIPTQAQASGDEWGIDIESFLLGTYSRRTSGESPEGRRFLLAEERLRLDLLFWSENTVAEARIKLDGTHDSVVGEFDVDLREAYVDYSTGKLDLRAVGQRRTTPSLWEIRR